MAGRVDSEKAAWPGSRRAPSSRISRDAPTASQGHRYRHRLAVVVVSALASGAYRAECLRLRPRPLPGRRFLSARPARNSSQPLSRGALGQLFRFPGHAAQSPVAGLGVLCSPRRSRRRSRKRSHRTRRRDGASPCAAKAGAGGLAHDQAHTKNVEGIALRQHNAATEAVLEANPKPTTGVRPRLNPR